MSAATDGPAVGGPGAAALPDRPRLTILYHFFHPDDVVSSELFSGLAADLAARGWDVEAVTSNRLCHADGSAGPPRQTWQDVRIRRVWRPGLRQASGKGRILNALWMIGAWSLIAFRRPRRLPQVLFIGTDPVLSLLTAAVVKTLRPEVKIVHWAYDLYPEAAVADGLLQPQSGPVRLLQRLLRRAYGSCDLVADLGSCMRERLEAYGHKCRKITLPPWTLAEPPAVATADPELRQRLFGPARLTLLYSGNFGRAHEYAEFLALARQLRDTGIVLGFAVRGNRAAELTAAVTPEDTNVRFLPFVPESELAQHLAAADVHLVSLRQHWTGIVVPSKFFGSLASGRPVLFAGEASSCLARWIADYDLGWRLDMARVPAVAADLLRLADTPADLRRRQQHCFDVYHAHFSRTRVVTAFDQELRALLR
ncbi:MAG TPA: glycosyltransferase family 4 protein [Gemmatales bacterium]|nr:glycosyltransferase family 4 protein [Gemmatales bacterium]